MPKSKIPSPARSQGALLTPRRNPARRTRSVGSPARSTASGRLSSIVDQFKDSNRQSVALSPLDKTFLSDNTDIDMPRRKSWWKNVDHSRDLVAVLENDDPADPVNVLEELDLELLSQEKKATQNYTLDLPDSSGSESISSIVLPQRRLFTQKENVPQRKKFVQIVSSRESITNHNKSREDKLPKGGPKPLFGDAKRSKPDFPAALITLSPDKTLANKTKDLAVDIQVPGKSLFGNRPGVNRKNMFADFILSESEDEIPEIQCKKFAFPKSDKAQPIRRSSANSRAIRGMSPTTSITTEMELDDWKLLPSSTMVDHQIQIHLNSPGRQSLRLSKLSEAKESTNADTSRQSNKSVNKNKDVENDAEEKSPERIEKYRTKIVEENQEVDDQSQKVPTNADSSRQINKSFNEDTEKAEEKYKYIDENIAENPEDNNESQRELTNADSSRQNNKSVNKNVDEEKAKEKTSENIENNQVIAENQKDKDYSQKQPPTNADTSRQSNKSVNDNVDKKEAKEISLEKIEKNQNEIVEENLEAKNEKQEEINSQEKNVLVSYEANQKEDEDGSQKKLEVNNIEQVIGLYYEEEPHDQEDEIKKSQEKQVVENQEEVGVDSQEEENLELSHEEAERDDQEDVEVSHKEADADDQGDFEVSHEEADSDNQEDINEESENEVDADEQEDDAEVGQEGVELDHQEEDNDERNRDDTEETNNETNDEGEQSDNEEVAKDGRQEENAVEADDGDITQEQESSNQNMNASARMDAEDDLKPQEKSSVCDEVDASGNKESLNELIDDSQECNEQNESEDDRGQNENEDSENEVAEDDQDEINEIERQECDEQIESEDDRGENENEDSENEVAEDDQDEINEMEINDSQNDAADSHDQNQNVYENEKHDLNDAEISHDTTGRNRKRQETKSPEAILNDMSNDVNSFTAKGRNTSIRNTKSVVKNFTFRPSMASARESTGLGDGTKNSSAEGSGWDSHRTTRKTMRQTFGRDFSPRKSLRALVMEKSAKRQTAIHEANAGLKIHQANLMEMPVEISDIDYDHGEPVESDHEISMRTRQTTLENYLQKIKKENIDRKQRIEEQVRNSLKSNPVRADVLNFKVPSKPALKRAAPKQQSSKIKRMKPSIIARENLPPELLEDMKYKPPKRFRPSNASWITNRLYKFLESKLEPKYDYKARVRAEKLVEMIYNFVRDTRRLQTAPSHSVNELKKEMARLEIVQTHFEFYNFFNEYMPLEIKVKVVPDIINDIPLPREGVFTRILV